MFLTLKQNNSGGSLLESKELGVGEYIIIEADNIKEALRRFEDIADNYNESQNEHSFYEYCECCGDRWNNWYKDDSDLFEVPCIGETPIDEFEWFRSGYIHYKTGEIKFFQTRE